jgi:hypothetical protein
LELHRQLRLVAVQLPVAVVDVADAVVAVERLQPVELPQHPQLVQHQPEPLLQTQVVDVAAVADAAALALVAVVMPFPHCAVLRLNPGFLSNPGQQRSMTTTRRTR